MSTKYKIIRDKNISNHDDSKIEVCDNRQEIVDFAIKESLNLIMELKESDCRDIDLFADVFELLAMLAEISYIDLNEIDELMEWKTEHQGEYSRYLLKLGSE